MKCCHIKWANNEHWFNINLNFIILYINSLSPSDTQGVSLAFSTAEPARPITDHRLAFSMVEPARTDGQTDGRREKWGEYWMREKSDGGRREKWGENWTRKKSDGGRREKWREKDKTTVGWRAFEVLKPGSWEWNPVPVYRGPETQVLRVQPSVLFRDPETQVLRAKYRGPETQCPESQMQQRGLAGTGGLCPTVTVTH
jgi:hypothetical protein